MSSYIYSIDPLSETIQEIERNNGVVIWHIPTAIVPGGNGIKDAKLKEGDILYIYLTSDESRKNVIYDTIEGLSKRIAYKALVLENLTTVKKNRLNKLNKAELKLFIYEISLKSSNALTLEKLKDVYRNANGNEFQPPQSYPTELVGKYDELKNYIENNIIIPMTYEEKIIDKKEKLEFIFKIKLDKNGNMVNSKKYSGNISSYLVKKYINEVLANNSKSYVVSEPNSYVYGSDVEWDLLLLKKEAMPVANLNVYKAEDVISLIEIKTSGIFSSNKDDLDNKFDKIKRNVDNVKKINNRIRYAYITYQENDSGSIPYWKITKEHLGDQNVFCFFLRNKESHENRWREFVLGLLE